MHILKYYIKEILLQSHCFGYERHKRQHTQKKKINSKLLLF